MLVRHHLHLPQIHELIDKYRLILHPLLQQQILILLLEVLSKYMNQL
jgi:predicted ATP-binding protein involved in virulence